MTNKKIQKMMQHVEMGQYVVADRLATDILIKESSNFEALYIKGVICGIFSKHEECKSYLIRAVKINPNHPYLQYNLAKAMSELGEEKAALEHHKNATKLMPLNHEAWNNYGKCFFNLKLFEDAVNSFNQAISINKNYYEAYSNKGNVLNEINRIDEALESYEKAIQFEPNNEIAYSNKGIALKKLKKFNEAIDSLNIAIKLKKDHFEAYLNRGSVLLELNRLEEALEDLDKAIGLKVDCVEAYSNRGKTLQIMKLLNEALISYEKAFKLKPDFEYVFGHIIHVKMLMCKWEKFDDDIELLKQKIIKEEKVIPSFEALSVLDSLSAHLKVSKEWINDKYPFNSLLGKIKKNKLGEKIKIGYFSADFREHPVSYLTAEMFELHNKEKFEIIAFYFGPPDNSQMHNRIKSAFDQFINAGQMSDKDTAEMSRNIGVDIAVDLTGLTGNGRIGIFAYRAAPIQLSYIGYLGSIGANYYDYLIADEIIIPEKNQIFYSEKIVYLPCYQVNDSKREISDRIFTKEELKLPEESFIFCCFNNNYKLTPTIFSSWMRILNSVKNSVLFIYAGNQWVRENLKLEAGKFDISNDRLIFADTIERGDYLARYKVADLFLDTYPYNAGTTASDALWTGLPILTYQGESFASRISSSLLTAVNLPELITTSMEEYEKMAIKLAENHEILNEFKQRLNHNKLKTKLFDSKKFTVYIELAYTKMYENYHEDKALDHIVIK